MGVDVIAKLSQKNGADFPIVNDTDVFNGFRVVATFASFASLKASTAGNGAMAFVTGNNSFYQFNGTTWIVAQRNPRPEYAVANSYFQIFVRSGGDDENNDGKSVGSPYATIDRALSDIPLKYTSYFMIDVGAGNFPWINKDYAFENAGLGGTTKTGIDIVGAVSALATQSGVYSGALVSGTVSTVRYTVPSYSATLTAGSHFAGKDINDGVVPFTFRDASCIIPASSTSTSIDIPDTNANFYTGTIIAQSYISAYQTFIIGNAASTSLGSTLSSFNFILPPTVQFIACTFTARDLLITSRVIAGQFTAFGSGSTGRITPPRLRGCTFTRGNGSMLSNVILTRCALSSGLTFGNCDSVSGCFFPGMTVVGTIGLLSTCVFAGNSTAFSALFIGQGDANQGPYNIGTVKQLTTIDFATASVSSFGCIEVTGPGSNLWINGNITVGGNYTTFLTIGGGGRCDWNQQIGLANKTVTGTVVVGIQAVASLGSTGNTLAAGPGSAYVHGAKLAMNGTLTVTSAVKFGQPTQTVAFSALPVNDLAATDCQLIIIN
ncbi:hypothetical protein UFOVP75_136 [uncultured Caudovirales phage]|uniref:Uncharacterized protein n=1 Tax=uncultured Caudovirales phage TaxID=2100421 RepID=A0A6J5L233_9CAUD|nr:hypothetical protein UFOVP75_136 [uncultured Caudovirales phage]